MEKIINYRTLGLARESRGLTQQELSDVTKIPQAVISRLECGTIFMDEKQVGKIADALSYPMNFFYQQIEIYPPNLHYRKRANIPSKIKEMAEARMNIYRSNINTLLKSHVVPDINLPLFSSTIASDPVRVATFMREFWRLPKGRIENMTALLETKGIIVIQCDFGTDKIDGRSMMTTGGQLLIFISKSLSGDRQRFTLAHELAHLALHIYSESSLSNEIEKDAHLFASEFLMPGQELIPQISGSKLTMGKLADLKRFWKVSMQAILSWAEHLKLVTSNQARYLWSQFNSLGIRTKEPIDISPEYPSLLKGVITGHLSKLKYSREELMSLLCLSGADFDNLYPQSDGPLRVSR